MEASEIAHNQGYKLRQWCPWFFFFFCDLHHAAKCMKGKVDLSTEPERYALKSRDVGEDFPDQKPKKKKKFGMGAGARDGFPLGHNYALLG